MECELAVPDTRDALNIPSRLRGIPPRVKKVPEDLAAAQHRLVVGVGRTGLVPASCVDGTSSAYSKGLRRKVRGYC